MFCRFSGRIPYGSHIPIIGRNGEGKSTLLKILAGLQRAVDGCLRMPKVMHIGYVLRWSFSHDSDFLEAIGVTDRYWLEEGLLH